MMPIGPTDDGTTAQRTAAIVRDLTGPDARCTAELPESEVEDDDA